jgi:hypothetical protein
MAEQKIKTITEQSHVTKKCPQCYTYIPLNALQCPSCKTKVGKVDKHGMATKRVDWGSYVICILAWLTLAIYVWFAFF